MSASSDSTAVLSRGLLGSGGHADAGSPHVIHPHSPSHQEMSTVPSPLHSQHEPQFQGEPAHRSNDTGRYEARGSLDALVNAALDTSLGQQAQHKQQQPLPASLVETSNVEARSGISISSLLQGNAPNQRRSSSSSSSSNSSNDNGQRRRVENESAFASARVSQPSSPQSPDTQQHSGRRDSHQDERSSNKPVNEEMQLTVVSDYPSPHAHVHQHSHAHRTSVDVAAHQQHAHHYHVHPHHHHHHHAHSPPGDVSGVRGSQDYHRHHYHAHGPIQHQQATGHHYHHHHVHFASSSHAMPRHHHHHHHHPRRESLDERTSSFPPPMRFVNGIPSSERSAFAYVPSKQGLKLNPQLKVNATQVYISYLIRLDQMQREKHAQRMAERQRAQQGRGSSVLIADGKNTTSGTAVAEPTSADSFQEQGQANEERKNDDRQYQMPNQEPHRLENSGSSPNMEPTLRATTNAKDEKPSSSMWVGSDEKQASDRATGQQNSTQESKALVIASTAQNVAEPQEQRGDVSPTASRRHFHNHHVHHSVRHSHSHQMHPTAPGVERSKEQSTAVAASSSSGVHRHHFHHHPHHHPYHPNHPNHQHHFHVHHHPHGHNYNHNHNRNHNHNYSHGHNHNHVAHGHNHVHVHPHPHAHTHGPGQNHAFHNHVHHHHGHATVKPGTHTHSHVQPYPHLHPHTHSHSHPHPHSPVHYHHTAGASSSSAGEHPHSSPPTQPHNHHHHHHHHHHPSSPHSHSQSQEQPHRPLALLPAPPPASSDLPPSSGHAPSRRPSLSPSPPAASMHSPPSSHQSQRQHHPQEHMRNVESGNSGGRSTPEGGETMVSSRSPRPDSQPDDSMMLD